GEMLPAQFERFARVGDGIITTYLDFDECRRVRALAEAALARRRRSAPHLPLCGYTPPRMGDHAAPAPRPTREFLAVYYGGGVHMRGVMGLGPAPEVIKTLRGYAEVGVTDLCIRFVGDDQIPQLERFTREVLPALRE